MISKLLRGTTLATCAALPIVGMTPPAVAKTFKLTVAAGQPARIVPGLKVVKSFFAPEVNRRLKAMGSKHRVRFRHLYAGSLLKPKKVFLGVQDGVADIGFVPVIFHPDKLPLDLVSFFTPFCTANLQKVTKAMDELHAKIPAMVAAYSKFNQIRLGGSGVANFHLLTNFPVKSVADMKGKKIATAGAALQWLRGIGVVPVDSNMMAYYNSTRTGVYQGFIIFPSSFPGMRYPEVAPYITVTGFGAMHAEVLTMNKDSLAKLPKDVQKAVLEAGRAWGPVSDKAHMGAAKWGMATTKKMFKKASVYELPAAERKKWAMSMPNIAKSWAGFMEKKGLPGKQVLATYMASLRAQGVKCARDWDKE